MEKQTGMVRGFATCFLDEHWIERSVEELIHQRLYALALGYEDLNDHNALREHFLLEMLVKKRCHRGESRAGTRPGQAVSRQEYAESSGALSRRGVPRIATRKLRWMRRPWKVFL